MHTPIHERLQHLTRRTFLGDVTRGIGSVALGSLMFPGLARAMEAGPVVSSAKLPHFAPKAKRVVCLFQSEGFSHVDLFDIVARHGLHYDQTRHTGIVFHMMNALAENGLVGMTAIANSHEAATALYDKTVRVLDVEAGQG